MLPERQASTGEQRSDDDEVKGEEIDVHLGRGEMASRHRGGQQEFYVGIALQKHSVTPVTTQLRVTQQRPASPSRKTKKSHPVTNLPLIYNPWRRRLPTAIGQ
ncbi:hypothetical protein GCM10008164_08100 [Achromobacter xylosoxidans]|nr:hypothetical protein GCM10008164_08100 [Achromobacter xylosoxidans]